MRKQVQKSNSLPNVIEIASCRADLQTDSGVRSTELLSTQNDFAVT